MKDLKFRNKNAQRYLEYLKNKTDIEYIGYVYYLNGYNTKIKVAYVNGEEFVYTRKQFIEKATRWCLEEDILNAMVTLMHDGESLSGEYEVDFREFAQVNGFDVDDVKYVYRRNEEYLNSEFWDRNEVLK